MLTFVLFQALVTSANSLLSPEWSLYMSNMDFLSSDSKCYSFDHRADGYARGEGVVVLVLKRLSDAIREGDSIRAVIRGTGSNQDGHTPAMPQPSQSAQEALIRQVYKSCSLGFESTRYIECHGKLFRHGILSCYLTISIRHGHTDWRCDRGNRIGPGFQEQQVRQGATLHVSEGCGFCPLTVINLIGPGSGSIKANIGHLEGGSGLAAILKSITILETGTIPPQALFEKLNPRIKAKFYHLEV